MTDRDFKRTFKPPTCTTAPWKYLIPIKERFEKLQKIKRECIEIYGYSLIECPKRLVCFTKQCVGRPLPWKSPTARPYLERFAKIQKFPVDTDYYIKDCSNCAIASTCKAVCQQVDDFINKDRKLEPRLIYKDTLDKINVPMEETDYKSVLSQDIHIPWDALNATRTKVIQMYVYDGKDFAHIAENLNLNNQARVKYEFYAALTTLSEVAVMRKFIEEQASKLSVKQLQILGEVYVKNKSMTQVANELKVTKQSVQQLVSRLIKKHKIKWHTFVKKRGNKVVYNLQEVLK